MILLRKGILVLFVLTVFLGAELKAQHHPHYSHNRYHRPTTQKGLLANDKLTFTLGLGASAYFGDICDGLDCAKPRPSAGAGVMVRFTDRIGAMMQINYFRLYAEDTYKARNFRFKSDNGEVFVAAYYSMFKYERYEFSSHRINPYAFLGFGMFYYAPQGYYKGGWYDLRSYSTEGVSYSQFAPMIPFGIGINFQVSSKVSLILEGAYRKTLTDYVDNVSSQTWIPESEFSNDIARGLANPSGMGDDYWKDNPVAYRGNPDKDDWYFISQVKLRYSLSKKRHKFSKTGLHKNKRLH